MITCRLGKLTDLSEVLAFAKRKLEDTNLNPLGFNAVIARRTVKNAMTSADSRVWVTERDGAIAGFLIGEIGPLPMTHHMGATDLAFLADAGGDLLLEAFKAWCKLRNVARIDMGISAGPEHDAAVRRMYGSKGFVYSGSMFHLNLLGTGDEFP